MTKHSELSKCPSSTVEAVAKVLCWSQEHMRMRKVCTYFNILQAIVPNVDLPLRDDKCNFWNHFETAIFLSLYLHVLHAF